MKAYSQEIAEAIASFLSDSGWRYLFEADEGIFEFQLGICEACVIKTLSYHIVVDNRGFSVVAYYPLGPDPSCPEKVVTMARFLKRVNFELSPGQFLLDLDDGQIRFKMHCKCSAISATCDMILDRIRRPSEMFRKYESGLLGILFQDMSDEEAEYVCQCTGQEMMIRWEKLRAAREKMCKESVEQTATKEAAEDAPSASPDQEQVPMTFEAFMRMLAEKAAENDAKAETPNPEDETADTKT